MAAILKEMAAILKKMATIFEKIYLNIEWQLSISFTL